MTAGPAISRMAFVEQLAALASEHKEAPKADKGTLGYLRTLTDLVLQQGKDAPPDKDWLQVFRDRIIKHPEQLRHELLGITAADKRRMVAEAPERGPQLDILGLDPDLLGPAGKLSSETAHTQTLAWAMAPERHQLFPELLQAFVALAASGAQVEPTDASERHRNIGALAAASSEGAIVRAERVFPEWGRVDLSIELPGVLLLVEAKLEATERPAQLSDYQKAAIKEAELSGAVPVVAFLNLDPDDRPSTATPSEAGKCPVVHITFPDLLRVWLPIVARYPGPDARYLALYLASLARICEVGDRGSFDDWSFRQRRKALRFIEDTSHMETRR